MIVFTLRIYKELARREKDGRELPTYEEIREAIESAQMRQILPITKRKKIGHNRSAGNDNRKKQFSVVSSTKTSSVSVSPKKSLDDEFVPSESDWLI